MPTFFDDIKAYVGFGDEDAALLRDLEPILRPHFEAISESFYARILQHPKAHAAITGGQAQVERLKRTLAQWMLTGLRGPHDEAFFELRSRIGRVHVRIGLPQQYMVTAMNVMRTDYRRVLQTHYDDVPALIEACNALDRLFDLELAIMLETYKSDSEERLRRRERLATVGQLAASIGHDLRNPLGVIESSLFILRKRVKDDPGATKHVEKIFRQARTCEEIVTALLDMARSSPPKVQSIDFSALFREIREGVPLDPGIELECTVDDGVTLEADPGLLRQTIVNLVGNAARALPGGGRISVSVKFGGRDDVAITVVDDGPGFAPDILSTAFEPLVSGRAKGIGLGLALVKSVAERHGGRATAHNREGGGAEVRVVLPRGGPPVVPSPLRAEEV